MTAQPFPATCPIPLQQYPHVLMAHGGGGRFMHQLIEHMFLPAFGSHPAWQHDAARLDLPHGRLAFTTDSYVVSPLFFAGGDIGAMAVYGTVNDLAMAGAKPLYLSLGFILEEGLPMETLWRVVQSIQAAAAQAGVAIVEALGHLDVESLAAEQCQEVKDWHSRIFLGQGCVIHWPINVPIKEDSVLLHQLAQSTVGSA